MHIDDVKVYLTNRGISKSGKKKAKLVALAYSCSILNIEIIAKQDDVLKNLKSEYDTLLETHGLTMDPKNFTSEMKFDDVLRWPKTNLGHIFEFLMNVREYKTEYIGKYKDQKAFSYWEDGLVGEVMCHDGENVPVGTVLYFSQVLASMEDESRDLWIFAEKAGKISAAWCNCTAGTFVCNHIIAALYKIEHANIMGFNDPAYTDMPCRWNHSKTAHVTGVRMNEVLIKKSVRSKEKSSSSILRDKRHSSVLIHDTIVKRW